MSTPPAPSSRLDAVVRQLESALSHAFDEALADRSTTRVEFLMLSVLAHADHPLTWEEVEARMPAQLGPATLTEAWAGLTSGNWVEDLGDGRIITAEGQEALEGLHTDIEDIHERAASGVTNEDYATAVAVMETMLTNLTD